MNKRLGHTFFYSVFISLYFFYGCATQSVPTGGDKDLTPPKVIASNPANQSVNFKGKTISLTFNEFVSLSEPQSKVIISPPLSKKPDYNLKGKSVVIDLNDSLKKNTTYTINFGTSIADITENNTLSNYHFAFSTGPVIDSLGIIGTVVNAYTQIPEKEVFVMLYKNTPDSTPIKEKPYYLSKTDVNGNFILSNLAGGKYKLFVLKDADADYLFNQPNEAIAFQKNLIDPTVVDSQLVLNLFEEDRIKQRITKMYAPRYGKLVVAFARPAIAPIVKAYKNEKMLPGDTIPNLWRVIEHSKNNDTLSYWFSNYTADSLHIVVTDTAVTDTAHIALIRKEEQKKQTTKGASPLRAVNSAQSNIQQIYAPLTFIFNNPIDSLVYHHIVFKEDTTLLPVPKIVADSTSKKTFYIKYAWKEESQYSIMIPKGVFKDIFGNTNDTIRITFSIRPLKEYGNLILKLNFKESANYILQLLDEKDVVVKQQRVNGYGKIPYEYLEPMKYRLKIIFDTNNNGKWDTGNYLNGIQPERTLYYKDILGVRANWELEIIWNVQ